MVLRSCSLTPAILAIGILSSASAQPTVPDGFTVHEVAYVGSSLQDIEPGAGGPFGTFLYVIVHPNQIYRVDPWGGTPTLFATIPGANLSSLRFGFDGDLYAVNGQGYVPSTVYRIHADGTSAVFSPSGTQSSEGIEYSPGGAFGNRLFVSEFNNCAGTGNPIFAIDAAGARVLFATVTSGACAGLTGLAFSPGGNFGMDLYGIHSYGGLIARVTPAGTNTQFVVNPPIGGAETLAFGNAGNHFGEYLYAAKDYSTEIHRISPTGQSQVFASGFGFFQQGGVTGLKFSRDGKMLFVTDDTAGIIYAITFPKLTCTGFDAPLDAGPVRVNKNRALPFKARLFDGDGNAITGTELTTGLPVIQVTFQPVTGPAIDVSGDAIPVGLGTDGNQFVFADDQWQFNLSTKAYTAPGTYVVSLEAGNSYWVSPTCTASFIVK